MNIQNSRVPYELFIDESIKKLAQPNQLVLDIGGGERFQKWLAPYKEILQQTRYQTMDYDAASGADVVGDIHAIPLATDSQDGVICHSVLEHVRNPIVAAQEVYRVLRPGGSAFFHVPSIYPYHARKGNYPDYWRIFDDTLEVLFEQFTTVTYVKRGGYFKALFFFLPQQHRLRWLVDPVSTWLDQIFKTVKGRSTTSGYYIYATK
ncbi:MAG: class I SAM-dependent methyltransferase [Candidatus Buchananbacteria bacterium]|nr:class I SAM-dependent methyltransferase [Candidatus Buchananbacteria bacterium]